MKNSDPFGPVLIGIFVAEAFLLFAFGASLYTFVMVIMFTWIGSLLWIALEFNLDMGQCCGKYGAFNRVLKDDSISQVTKANVLEKILKDMHDK
jgi:predicted membrane-bound spermidine synthase